MNIQYIVSANVSHSDSTMDMSLAVIAVTSVTFSHFTSDDDVLKQNVLLQCHERNAELISETPLNIPSRFGICDILLNSE